MSGNETVVRRASPPPAGLAGLLRNHPARAPPQRIPTERGLDWGPPMRVRTPGLPQIEIFDVVVAADSERVSNTARTYRRIILIAC